MKLGKSRYHPNRKVDVFFGPEPKTIEKLNPSAKFDIVIPGWQFITERE
jgi:hypothetical protein